VCSADLAPIERARIRLETFVRGFLGSDTVLDKV
jgi:hypothetical protein